MEGKRTSSRIPYCFRVALGCLLAVSSLFAVAEGFLRFFPTRDLHPYLGEESPLVGNYVADEDFGATYRSWEDFVAENCERLAAYLPLDRLSENQKVWAFFGNSFVQAPEMLADHTRALVRDRQVFNLGRNELLPIRFAQIRWLLSRGLKPERIFVLLMPVDVVPLGRQPLATLRVTERGALTYEMYRPERPAGWLLDNSRLARTAWIRLNKHHGNPRFDPRKVCEEIDPMLSRDLESLFANLARHTLKRDIPVTVMLVPSYHQITCGAGFGFQDMLIPILRGQGYDVFDPRKAFCSHAEARSLFLPDLHFNADGNRLLLAELLRHIGYGSHSSERVSEASRP